MFAQVTAKYVGGVFLTHSVVMSVIMAEIDSLQKISPTYHQQKGCGYGRMTVLKFCRL